VSGRVAPGKLRGLYAIADVEALARHGLDLEPFARAVLAARPAALQLRDKRSGAREVLARLRLLAPLCAEAGVPLFANDRADLAVLGEAAGVHLGQTDLPADLVRGRWPELAVGVSTHTDDQLDRALEVPGLAYVAIGPIFPTASKTGDEGPAPTVGLLRLVERARRARERRPEVAVLAIGGIDLQRAPVVSSVADAIAVIGALLPPGSPAPPPGGPHPAPYEAVRQLANSMNSIRYGPIA